MGILARLFQPVPSFLLSALLVCGVVAILRRLPSIGRWAERSPGRFALWLFALSLVLPAFRAASDVMFGGVAAIYSFAMAPAVLGGSLFAPGLSCLMGALANLCFLVGGVCLRLGGPRVLVKRLATTSLVVGGLSLLPFATGGDLNVVFPGFALWLLSFWVLRGAAAAPEPVEEALVEEAEGERVVVESGPHRCAYCHESDDSPQRACPTCRTSLHTECWLKAETCPTLGCEVMVRRIAPPSPVSSGDPVLAG